MTKYILKTKLGQRLGIFYNEWATFCVLGRVFAPISLVTLYFEFSNYDGVPTRTVPNSQVEIVNYELTCLDTNWTLVEIFKPL